MITQEQVRGLKKFRVRYVRNYARGAHFPVPIGKLLIASNDFSSDTHVYIRHSDNPELGRGIEGYWDCSRFELAEKISVPKIIVRENKIKTDTEVYMEEKEIIQVKKHDLCKLKIKRDIDGLTVFIQSEIIEEYFKNASGGDVQVGKVAWNKDIEGYKYPTTSFNIPGLSRCPRLDMYDYDYLIDNEAENLNLSFLRMKGVGAGVTMKFKGLFLAKDIARLKKDVPCFITSFYTEYIRLCEFEITITAVS